METQLDYAPPAQARHSYTPPTTGSHAYAYTDGNDVREVYIGGDVEPREGLRHVTTESGIRYYMGTSRDGVGVGRLENYEYDLETRNGTDPRGLSGDGFKPFKVQPHLYLDSELLGPENTEIARALDDGVRILNDALPPEYQIVVVEDGNAGDTDSGGIMVNLESASAIGSICGETAVACAQNKITGDFTNSSVLYLPEDLDTSEYSYPRSTIIHELLHALGIHGHVDSIEFPDSIMGTAGESIPNLGHVLSRIDREALQIMYMSQRSDLYNDWGEWSDTSFHLAGRSEDEALNFGVALFNGLPQPWVRGATPDADLADNDRQLGTAKWTGGLVGFSGPSPIAGDAELEVRLATLADPDNEQDLRFRDIYLMSRSENQDLSASSARWFDTRNIDYKVNVSGNVFQNVRGEGDEPGYVSGAFLGSDHEHMGGTLKRTDMVAAFGGSMSGQSAKPTPQEDILLAELLPDPSHSFPALSASLRRDWNARTVTTASIVRSIASDGSDGFVVTYEDPAQGERVVEFDVTDFQAPDGNHYFIERSDGSRNTLWSVTDTFRDGPSNVGSSRFDYFDVNGFNAAGPGFQYRSYLVYGVETEAVPVAGTATYSGVMWARMYFQDDPANSSSQHRVNGALTLEADFGAGTIGGSIGSVRIRPPGMDEFQDDPMTMSIAASPIRDSGFVGRWSEDGAGGFTGEVEARFFGPAANEIGGVMSGTDPHEGLILSGVIGGTK